MLYCQIDFYILLHTIVYTEFLGQNPHHIVPIRSLFLDYLVAPPNSLLLQTDYYLQLLHVLIYLLELLQILLDNTNLHHIPQVHIVLLNPFEYRNMQHCFYHLYWYLTKSHRRYNLLLILLHFLLYLDIELLPDMYHPIHFVL